jgi:acetyl-CoA carboxylase biotin carboxylase subunit
MPRVRRRRIQKLLVANRGEIACRIVRAAREMGIPTVAVYSDPDAGGLPVRLANEVVYIGPADPAKSYLNQDAIIKAAKDTRCNAIHPGYGFLAENASFAEKCRRSRLIFIGPTADNIRKMGDKTFSKRLALEAGIPVIPGTLGTIDSPEEAREIADEFGYPVILKAAAGGGGRGMRIARNPDELIRGYESCRHEALASFGSDAIFVEKLIERPRHIEVQILADGYGNIVHFGERDCTIQRRHQKLIEEAPSPVIDPDTRDAMGAAACALCARADYLSAGTVEFLLDTDGQFYFMEMNTRIQVEHPVTELVTGFDLLKRQIEIAQGEKLDISQDDVVLKGHVIECRINAEDPNRNFLPTPGRIDQIIFPLGPGVRVDSSAFSGSYIPREYDSLIAKVIVHADTRAEAIARMKRALLELKIGGVRSTANFHFAIMNNPLFEQSDYDTQFIDDNLEHIRRGEFANPEIAAIAAAVEAYLRTHRRLPVTSHPAVRSAGAWKESGRVSNCRDRS